MIDEFSAKLKAALLGELPGLTSHQRMMSYQRITASEAVKSVPDARMGSVLVPIYPHRGELYTSLMLRPKYAGVHSGQISFPGGKREGNESIRETALRESNEELGIIPDKVEILGTLSQVFIPPSKFLVTPHIGVLRERPQFVPDAREVEKVLEVPLSFLLSNHSITTREVTIMSYNSPIKVKCFLVEENVIWGATAMIISELKDISDQLLHSK
jgi:8-oxo-dGTP pyrophosphatase MutT (NUDIX family)